jgi:hypothetical protein
MTRWPSSTLVMRSAFAGGLHLAGFNTGVISSRRQVL